MKRVLRGPLFLQTTFDEPFSSTKGQRQMVLGRTSALQEEPFFLRVIDGWKVRPGESIKRGGEMVKNRPAYCITFPAPLSSADLSAYPV